MTINDPIAAYNAASNVEAHMICGVLVEAGIEAMVIEDVSMSAMTRMNSKGGTKLTTNNRRRDELIAVESTEP